MRERIPRSSARIHERPGVVVAICGKNGTLIRYDPAAWRRAEWEKYEKARREWRRK